MSAERTGSVSEVLAARRDGIVQEWLARTLQTYPEHTSRFLGREKDRFRNPVGHTMGKALPALFDELLGGMDRTRVMALLDGVVKIRAVQDFTAAQAVAFVFLLKNVVRDELGGATQGGPEAEGLAVLEGRIDEMALLAFDLFMECRERIYQIRAAEAKRRVYLLQRMDGKRPFAAGLPFPAEQDEAGSGE
jgi:hypothetical protein